MRPSRLPFSRDKRRIKHECAFLSVLSIDADDLDDALPHLHKAGDDPIERTTINNRVGLAGPVPRYVPEFGLIVRGRREARVLHTGELVNALDPDAKF